MGGMIAVTANAFFAAKFFSCSGAQNSKDVLRAFYIGECRKFVATLFLFFLAMRCLTLAYGYFFVGVCVGHMAFWLATALPLEKRALSQMLAEQGS